jgi:hypothetical protein
MSIPYSRQTLSTYKNHRAILNDPERYIEPDTFNPERFIQDGEVDKSILNPIDVAFGFGRRICPGQHIAVSMLKLTVASVLSVFDLSKAKDEAGREIEPTKEYHESMFWSVQFQLALFTTINSCFLCPAIPRNFFVPSNHDHPKQCRQFGQRKKTDWVHCRCEMSISTIMGEPVS